MEYAVLAVIVGALLVWAYYAPRLIATLRQVQDRRRITTARRVNRLERLAPGDPDTDAEFDAMVRRADPAWANAMRRASRAQATGQRWQQGRRRGQMA